MGKSAMSRVRHGKRSGRVTGHLVTWDIDRQDKALNMRLYHFVFGREDLKSGRIYRKDGFVARTGVRYLGQSVLFVPRPHLSEILAFLERNRIDHETMVATLG